MIRRVLAVHQLMRFVGRFERPSLFDLTLMLCLLVLTAVALQLN